MEIRHTEKIESRGREGDEERGTVTTGEEDEVMEGMDWTWFKGRIHKKPTHSCSGIYESCAEQVVKEARKI